MAALQSFTTSSVIYSTTKDPCGNLSCYFVLENVQRNLIGSMCCLAGLITFLENILVLVAIGASARLRKLPSFLFIASLAVADVLASSFFPITFLHFHISRHVDSPEMYLFQLGGVTMAFTGSVGSLLLTAMDRYLCIYHAPRYKLLLTRRKALYGIVGLWIMTFVISFLPLFGWRCKSKVPCSLLFPYIDPQYLGCWVVFMLVVLFLIVIAYVLILWKAHQHEAAMELPKVGQSMLVRQNRMRVDIRLAQTLGLILLILVFCWLPTLSMMIVDVSRKLNSQEQKAFAFCGTLCLVNSAVNPLLYALRCRELRRALLNLQRRVYRRCIQSNSVCACVQRRYNVDGQVDRKDFRDTLSESSDRHNLN